jgi:hypothetical protein
MALKDKLTGFIDNLGLKDAFETQPRDATKARQPVLRGLDKTLDQFQNGKVKAPNKWWSANNNVVAFSPSHNGAPLLVNAQTTNFIPAERFADFLGAMKAAVEAGEFDDEIEQLDKGRGSAGGSAQVKVPRASGTRAFSEQSRANISVAGRRKGGKTDAEIEAMMLADGYSADSIKVALARKKA